MSNAYIPSPVIFKNLFVVETSRMYAAPYAAIVIERVTIHIRSISLWQNDRPEDQRVDACRISLSKDLRPTRTPGTTFGAGIVSGSSSTLWHAHCPGDHKTNNINPGASERA